MQVDQTESSAVQLENTEIDTPHLYHELERLQGGHVRKFGTSVDTGLHSSPKFSDSCMRTFGQGVCWNFSVNI